MTSAAGFLLLGEERAQARANHPEAEPIALLAIFHLRRNGDVLLDRLERKQKLLRPHGATSRLFCRAGECRGESAVRRLWSIPAPGDRRADLSGDFGGKHPVVIARAARIVRYHHDRMSGKKWLAAHN